MTEKDYEIQNLRRENALLKKSRDLFKEQFYTEARKVEKLKAERDAALSQIDKYCDNCKYNSSNLCGRDNCIVCKNKSECRTGLGICVECIFHDKWEWRGVQHEV